MIDSIVCKETAKIWGGEFSKKLPNDIQKAARRKLSMIHAASKIDDLRIPPKNKLEKLSGDRAGQYSIRIKDQWRVCFYFEGGNATEVEIVDYH